MTHDERSQPPTYEQLEVSCRILADENEQLRDALGVILAGLTDALGDPMGARPSQVMTLYSIARHAMRPDISGSDKQERP